MKQILTLLCVLLALSLIGCQQSEQQADTSVAENVEFPRFIVGTWKAQGENSWELTFDPDGNVSSVVINMGKVMLEPGKTTYIPMKEGGESSYEPGGFVASYDKSQKELTVRISVKHSYIELVGGIVEGSSEDVFSGAFTEDGKTWNVTWTSFPKYIARTEDKAEINLSKNVTEEGVTTSLVFEKEVKK